MAANRRVAEQHEDWLNLADAEAPWFSLPVLKRAFPNGLDPVPSEIRAEHKARWYGGDAVPAARSADDRTEYVAWLLRDVLGWRDGYLTGARLPGNLASGVTRHDVTVAPTGVYQPTLSAPVGLFGEPTSGDEGGDERPRVLVFVLPAGTDPRARPTGDAWPATWVQRAALACRYFEVPLALMTDGDHLTLVHAPGGGATGWGSWRASEFATEPVLLDSFRSMLRVHRFVAVADKDTPEALLTESAGTQAEVTDQLGSQVRKATELLVNAISRADRDRGGALLDQVAPHEVYEAAVTVMMRTVFLLVAEENDLLPVDNADYQRLYAIRTLRESLVQQRYDNPEVLETRTTAWHRLLATSRAVHSGVYHEDLSVPAYGGDLFDPDRFPFLEGRTADGSWRTTTGTPIPVTDLDVLAILDALLVLRFIGAAGVTDTRRLSYRHVDVEQIGYIYERLLDHDAVEADEVVLGLRGRSGDEPEVGLSTLEAKRIDGEKAVVDYLCDRAAKDARRYVGTANQVSKLLGAPVDGHLRAGLIQACQGDQVLAKRIEPFANLLRLDLRDRPMVFLPDAVYVTETGSRRDSGTAYTTKELADEVAEHALAPLAYSPGPQDTPDTNEWQIRPSAEILALKVCDPAVGSGAILVAACRYLAEGLIEAWRAEGDPRAAETATAADDPNRLDVVVEARRLVAEHCCYGVDRNPMAVEMAKMSMWLTTVARDRPFTFLDHALKAGDSLLGTWSLDQLRYLHYDVQAGRQRALPISGWSAGGDALLAVECLIDEALDLRREVQSIDTRSPADVERKQRLHAESEDRLSVLSAIADVVAGAAISTAGERDPVKMLTARVDADAEVIGRLVASLETPGEAAAIDAVRARTRLRLDAGRPDEAPERRPLHWPIAFPEVFTGARRGFDAMVGNPPYMGNKYWKERLGPEVQPLFAMEMDRRLGKPDLIVLFIWRMLQIMRPDGYAGLLSTQSITEVESKSLMQEVVLPGATIYRARRARRWPGSETVTISQIWLRSGKWNSQFVLDDRVVTGIGADLREEFGQEPQELARCTYAFEGVHNARGSSFLVDPDHPLATSDLFKPYISGDDITKRDPFVPRRMVLDLTGWSANELKTLPHPVSMFLSDVVQPVRTEDYLSSYRGLAKRWWTFWNTREEGFDVSRRNETCIAIPAVAKYILPIVMPSSWVFTNKVVVVEHSRPDLQEIMLSQAFDVWAEKYGGTMGATRVMKIGAVIRTFSLPESPVNSTPNRWQKALRAALPAWGPGTTEVLNRVNDPTCIDDKIEHIRTILSDVHISSMQAYGWHDLAIPLTYVEGSSECRWGLSDATRQLVLRRLLELNDTLYKAEVVDGLHRRPTGRATARTAAARQPSLLGDDA